MIGFYHRNIKEEVFRGADSALQFQSRLEDNMINQGMHNMDFSQLTTITNEYLLLMADASKRADNLSFALFKNENRQARREVRLTAKTHWMW